jgi:RNA polymerase sigma-70 factor (ECF subfamily)
LDLDSLEHIIRKCLKSDRKCQQWIYEHYYGYALKIAYRYMEDYQEAVSVTNDSFVKAFLHLKQFEIDANSQILELRFRGWLRRITVNESIDQIRKRNRDIQFEPFNQDDWMDKVSEEKADAKLLYKELIKYMKELPPSYQKVFNLYVIDGFSHAEIAIMLEISVGTSKSNLSRAKDFLQNKIVEFFETKKS